MKNIVIVCVAVVVMLVAPSSAHAQDNSLDCRNVELDVFRDVYVYPDGTEISYLLYSWQIDLSEHKMVDGSFKQEYLLSGVLFDEFTTTYDEDGSLVTGLYESYRYYARNLNDQQTTRMNIQFSVVTENAYYNFYCTTRNKILGNITRASYEMRHSTFVPDVNK